MSNEKLETRTEKRTPDSTADRSLTTFPLQQVGEPAQAGGAQAAGSKRPAGAAQPVTSRSQYLARLLTDLGVLALIAIGFALRLCALAGESLWYDELLQLDIAQGAVGSILPQLPRHAAVPLDYLITHFWILLGRQDNWVRLPAVMIGTLTLPVAYQLGRSWLGRRAGLLFMILLTLSPFHVRYSQEARPYALVMLGVILTGYAVWQFWQTGRRRYLIPLQVGVLIFSLSHFFATLVFGPLLILALINLIFEQNRQKALNLLKGLLGTGLVALVCLLLLGWGEALYYTIGEFGKAVVEPEKFTVEAEQKPNQGEGPQVNWPFVKHELLSPLGPGGADPSLWLFNGLAGLGLMYLLLQKRYSLSLLLVSWFIVPIVLIVAFLVYRGTFFASRYIITVLPAYLALLTAGLLALPRWLRCAEPKWLSLGAFLVLSGFVGATSVKELDRLYHEQKNEDWRLVSQFLAQNASPADAVIAVNAESTMNWYYPQATAQPDHFDQLATIEATVNQANRSWVIMSIFTVYMREEALKIRAWLSEQGAIRLVFDPVIDVYYLGPAANPPQLLKEIQGFALPVDHALYASLARENRREPAVARRYYQLAIEHAPDEETLAEYQAALEALNDER